MCIRVLRFFIGGVGPRHQIFATPLGIRTMPVENAKDFGMISNQVKIRGVIHNGFAAVLGMCAFSWGIFCREGARE